MRHAATPGYDATNTTADGNLGSETGERTSRATLCVTHCELNNRHCTGALPSQIFVREPAVAVIWSLQLFRDECSGDMSLRIRHISDAAMRLLVDRSAIGFAISPLLCEVYGQKFRKPFWLLPRLGVVSAYEPEQFADAVRKTHHYARSGVERSGAI